MRILMVHNAYQQSGGEDIAYNNDVQLLRRHGHEVREYLDHNERIPRLNVAQLAFNTVWNSSSYKRMRETLKDVRADVVHFHNTFPLISPSAYYAVDSRGIPVVQTLHNYRLVCPNALLLRDGEPCEDCIGKPLAWPSVVHACYRGSKRTSLAVAAMLGAHSMIGTWQRKVDVYIALSDFARKKFIAGGLPKDRIVVRPNYALDDSGVGEGRGGYALYVGRLSREKGILVLLSAWAQMERKIPLIIIGEGNESTFVIDAAKRLKHVTWLGAQPREQVLSFMRQAQMLIIPSICYENFPVVIGEAYACGLPVAASRIGSLPDIIRDGETGLLFRAGDPADLVKTVCRLWDSDAMQLRKRARSEFDSKYSAEPNYLGLMDIYRRAASRKSSRAASCTAADEQPPTEARTNPVSFNAQ